MALKTHRQGNDFKLTLQVYRLNNAVSITNDTVPEGAVIEDLTDAQNIKLSLYCSTGACTILKKTVNVNVLVAEIPANIQAVGTYYILLEYDKVDITLEDGLKRFTTDFDAFKIVDKSAYADTEGDMSLIGVIKVGLDGKSAYQYAQEHGYTGTEYEFGQLQYESTLAAINEAERIIAEQQREETFNNQMTSINEAISTTNTAIINANTAAINANDNAILAKSSADNADQKAELANEAATNANIATTLANEAKINADNAALIANTAATNANDKATLADQKATLADSKATLANNAANTANTAATAATNAATSANNAATAANGQAGTYNVTVAVPLTAGNYYNSTTARSAVPSNVRLLGRVITYATSSGVWYTEKFIGTDVANWTTAANWEYVPRNSDLVQIGSNLNTLSSDVAEIKKWNTRVYGVEFTKGQLDPVPTRWIGDTYYKTNHYIYEQFKVAKVKAGVVIGYLDQTNWNLMEDGTASGIVIDGTTITDDGADIMLVNPNPFYAILGGTHATLERRLVADTPFSYDGDSAILIPAHGVCVDFSVIKSGVQRSIRDNTLVGSGAAGIGGLSYLSDGKGCPKTETSRFNYELYARAKNADNTKNIPYANAFQLDLNVWFTLLCIKFQTKDLHATSVLGKCISSNDSAPTVANWGTMTGVRVTNADASYSYYQIGSSRFGTTGTTTTKNFWEIINNYRPLLKMFEMQLALSYAKANLVAEGLDFTYDGSTYNYVNIAGHKNITTGEMTAKVRKKVQFSFSGYDSVVPGEVTGRIIDVVLEQAIVKGKIAGWGNCWQWVSGIDAVCDNTGTLNNQYTFYQTNDVTKLTTDTDSTDKVAGVTFNFEKVYNKIGILANTGGNTSNYSKQNNSNSIVPLTLGTAGLHTGECQNIYMGSATSGYRARKGVCFGGLAYIGNCALRCSNALYAPTNRNTNIAGGFRVAL